MPSLSAYQQEVLEIVNEMILVKKEITPILSDILFELVNQAEISGKLMNVRTFTMFMSHGTSYLQRHQKLYENLVKIIDRQFSEGFNSLRFREPKVRTE